MSDMGSHNFPAAQPFPADEPVATPAPGATRAEGHNIGEVIEIAGSSSRILMDATVLTSLAGHPDPTVKMAGQVGSQVKVRVGTTWLIANIRTQKLHRDQGGIIIAEIDFLGEGDEEMLTGNIYNFRRGVTRYPIPGSDVYAVTTSDLKQIYASDGRAHRSEEHTSELQSRENLVCR